MADLEKDTRARKPLTFVHAEPPQALRRIINAILFSVILSGFLYSLKTPRSVVSRLDTSRQWVTQLAQTDSMDPREAEVLFL